MPLAITPTFSPWTRTSDDSYIYQLLLVLATATVSLRIHTEQRSYYVTLLLIIVLRGTYSFSVSDVTDVRNIYLGLFTEQLLFARLISVPHERYIARCFLQHMYAVTTSCGTFVFLFTPEYQLASPPGFHFAHISKGILLRTMVYIVCMYVEFIRVGIISG